MDNTSAPNPPSLYLYDFQPPSQSTGVEPTDAIPPPASPCRRAVSSSPSDFVFCFRTASKRSCDLDRQLAPLSFPCLSGEFCVIGRLQFSSDDDAARKLLFSLLVRRRSRKTLNVSVVSDCFLARLVEGQSMWFFPAAVSYASRLRLSFRQTQPLISANFV
ncbi:hypothetical protein JCGZ_12791 [Jatropha curcas]|uniref:Uncharacterized protein n=1 Tax=Jatropha curcas TaxID=180498 RepID=A0A067KDX4_JATCU|nr:hypothetical protein JCGZ_12791 [Jatropha curcas]